MFSLFSIFSACDKKGAIDNKYLTATAPEDYVELKNEADDILFLDKVHNGLESIFSIDNTQDIIVQPNSETITQFTPKEILITRLQSIEEDTKQPGFNWKKFTLIDPPKEITFKNYKGAEATFTVEENVNDTGKVVHRKIKRIVIFTSNDLWNFVLAPSESANYDKEMNEFNDIMESIEIKK